MDAPAEPPNNASRGRLAFAIRCIGLLVTALCVFYVAKSILANEEALARLTANPWSLGVVLFASLLWIGVNGCLAMLWRGVASCVCMDVSRTKSLTIAYLSQIAKYLPGNVFHFAGRVWHARALGFPAKRASLATLGESLALVGVALLIGLPILGTLPYGKTHGLGIGIAVGAFSIALLVRRSAFERLLEGMGVRKLEASGRSLALILFSSIGVFALQYAMFLVVASSLEIELDLGLFEGFQMITLTWLAGFVVVGSPGGIGVREAAFALFASGAEMQSTLLLIAALMRLVSVMGDALSYAIGAGLKKYIESNENGASR